MVSESFFTFFKNLFHNDFMPHGHCYFWRPDVLWLNAISDGVIALSYYAIPLILISFMMKRKDFPFPWVLVMFGAFILLCGTTHVMAIITLWDPIYRLDGIIKAATATVSIITTVALIPLIPLALALKSPKELEAANLKLGEANDKLKEIDRLKDNFFSNISHELRTPLTLILAPLESFLANDYGSLTETQRKNLEAMHNNSIRLFQMVNSILDFAKISAKKIEVKREAVDIVLLTQSITNEFIPIINQKGLQIHFECPVKKQVVDIDRYLYERILFNLLANAVKFTPAEGDITVSLHFDNGTTTLTVKDAGIGISAADQEKLFQRFQQIEGSSTRRFEGTGIGLALVKEFSLLLGGDVTVASELGKGSCFVVKINTPLSHANEAIADKSLQGRFQKFAVSSVNTQNNASGMAKIDESECKILVAEDNLELASYLVSLLSEFAQVKHVQDGEAALELIKSWEPTIAVLDVMMPKMDGITLCREIKTTAKTEAIQVILLTALTHRDALLRGWEAGADEYLFKPFHPKELTTRIKQLIARAHNHQLIQELNKKLIDAARLAGMSEISRSILHNVGNALNSVNVSANLLLEKLSGPDNENLQKITHWIKDTVFDHTTLINSEKKQADLILYLDSLNEIVLRENNELIDEVKELNTNIRRVIDIVALQRKNEGLFGVVEEVDLNKLLDDILAVDSGAYGIHVVKKYQNDSAPIVVDKMRLQQILINLILNAKETLSISQVRDKVITIVTQTKTEQNKKWLEIQVIDNGLGIAPENINKIFSFGFTTKPKGAGIGLHVSAISATEMGGTLTVKSEGKNSGATFILKLPAEPLDIQNWVEIG